MCIVSPLLLLGSGFSMENNMAICKECYGALYGSTCHGCNQRIGGDELWVEALEHTWHPACFICEVCGWVWVGGCITFCFPVLQSLIAVMN